MIFHKRDIYHRDSNCAGELINIGMNGDDGGAAVVRDIVSGVMDGKIEDVGGIEDDDLVDSDRDNNKLYAPDSSSDEELGKHIDPFIRI